MKHLKQKDLQQAGWDARMNNQPCEAPTSRERDRAAWVQGWKAANAMLARRQMEEANQ